MNFIPKRLLQRWGQGSCSFHNTLVLGGRPKVLFSYFLSIFSKYSHLAWPVTTVRYKIIGFTRSDPREADDSSMMNLSDHRYCTRTKRSSRLNQVMLLYPLEINKLGREQTTPTFIRFRSFYLLCTYT